MIARSQRAADPDATGARVGDNESVIVVHSHLLRRPALHRADGSMRYPVLRPGTRSWELVDFVAWLAGLHTLPTPRPVDDRGRPHDGGDLA